MSTKRTVDPSQIIPFREKFGYALGDFASNLFWMPFVLFGTYYYTDVFGISATAVGVMLLVTRIWDTVNDPMMGLIADRTRPRPGLGRYRPYLLWMAVPFGIIGSAAFLTPSLGPTGKLIYAWVTYTAFGMIYTAINIPYSALMSVMSKEPEERSSTSFFRMVGAQVAGLLVSSGLLYFVTKIGGGKAVAQQQRGFFIVMSVLAALSVLLWILTSKATRERVIAPESEQGDVARDLKAITSCWPWWLLFAISFFTIAAFTLRFGVAAYYFKYYADQPSVAGWSLIGPGAIDAIQNSLGSSAANVARVFAFNYEGGAISAFFTLNTIAGLLGVFSFSFLSKLFDKKKLYLVLILVAGLVSLNFEVLNPTNITGMVLTQALFSFITGPLGAVLFAMYTDISVYVRYETGTSASGLVMAAGSFAQKFGWAVGGAMTGLLLGWAGYVPDQPQTDQVRRIMQFMMSWAPAICCVIGALFMVTYPLDDRRVHKLTRALETEEAEGVEGSEVAAQ